MYVQIVCRNLCETQEASRLLCRRYADHCRRHIVEIMLTTTTKPTSCTKFRFDSIFFLLVFLVVVVFLHDCISCPGTNRIEETVISRLHIGHSYVTQSFLLKGEEPPVSIPCDELLTIEHNETTLLFRFYWNKGTIFCGSATGDLI